MSPDRGRVGVGGGYLGIRMEFDETCTSLKLKISQHLVHCAGVLSKLRWSQVSGRGLITLGLGFRVLGEKLCAL